MAVCVIKKFSGPPTLVNAHSVQGLLFCRRRGQVWEMFVSEWLVKWKCLQCFSTLEIIFPSLNDFFKKIIEALTVFFLKNSNKNFNKNFSIQYFLGGNLQHLSMKISLLQTKVRSDRREIIFAMSITKTSGKYAASLSSQTFLYKTLTLITRAVINLHSIPGRSTFLLKHCRCFLWSLVRSLKA